MQCYELECCAEKLTLTNQGLPKSFMFFCCFPEDPVALRASLRAESNDFVDVNQEEFESVSELIRVRLKLSEVNAVSENV